MSVTVRLFDHPFAGVAPSEHRAESVGAWLLSHYGTAPGVRIEVYRGEPSEATRVTDLQEMQSPEGAYTVLQFPGFSLAAFQIIALVITAINLAVQLFNTPKAQPANVNRTSASANNSLSDRSNSVRLLQRIEDIYGTVLSVPSLIAPTYTKYRNNRRVEYGYYCVGRGYYTLNELKDADSLLGDVSGASASVYGPFTSPNSGDTPQLQIGSPILDLVATVRRSDEVDGLTLKAANQLNTPESATYRFTGTSDGDIITQQSSLKPNFNSIATPGDTITINVPATPRAATASPDYPFAAASDTSTFTATGGEFSVFAVGDVITGSNWGDAGNNRDFTITAITGQTLQVTPAPVDESNGAAILTGPVANYSGTREIAQVGDGDIVLVGTQFLGTLTLTGQVQLNDRNEWTDWITMTTADQDEISVNVAARSGLYSDAGAGRALVTVTFDAQIERLDINTGDPTGQVETFPGQLQAATDAEQGVTYDYAPSWTGPSRVRMRRSSQFDYTFAGTIVDEITWTDLLGSSPLNVTEFGNVTTIQTVTLPTVRATSLRNRELNVLASRMLPIYNGTTFSGALDSTGRLVSGTIAPTSRMVDILAAVSFDPRIGNRQPAELDLAQISAAQAQIGDAMAQFNYTLDSDATTYEETVAMIADAAFCTAYRQSGKIRVYPDVARSASVAQITHRNSKPGSQSVTRTFTNDSEYDGIVLTYNDPDTQVDETIRIPTDGTAIRPKKVEVPGIRSFPQAWYRAQREYRKLTGRRIAMEVSATLDGRALIPGARVDIVDNTHVTRMDGEVLGQSGLTLTLSQIVTFTPGELHSIVLTRRNGDVEGIRCTPGVDAYTVVLASAPGEAIKTTNDADGVRTIYSFAADNVRDSLAYTVQSIDPPQNGYVVVKAANYSADFYAGDTEPVPDKYTVIN